MGRVSGVISRHRSKEQGTAALQRLEERTPVVETKVVPPLPRRHSIQKGGKLIRQYKKTYIFPKCPNPDVLQRLQLSACKGGD